MRLILQRVLQSEVSVEGEVVGKIGSGLLVLVGVEKSDDEESVSRAADKLVSMRVFADEEGKMNLSAIDCSAAFLVVSQFTLAGTLNRGRRPSFDKAAPPAIAEPLVDLLSRRIESHGLEVARGRFGAYMHVSLVNDGPVTFVLDT